MCDAIIDHLWDDLGALKACSLTCRNWNPSARNHLFYSMTLDGFWKINEFDKFIHENPSFASLVREFHLDTTFINTLANHNDRSSWWTSSRHHLGRNPNSSHHIRANEQIVRISQKLHNVHSLRLEAIQSVTRPALKEETLFSVLSMPRNLRRIRMVHMDWEDIEKILRFLRISPTSACATISVDNTKINFSYSFAMSAQNIPTTSDLSPAGQLDRITIVERLSFFCHALETCVIMEALHALSCAIRPRSLIIRVSDLHLMSEIMRDEEDLEILELHDGKDGLVGDSEYKNFHIGEMYLNLRRFLPGLVQLAPFEGSIHQIYELA